MRARTVVLMIAALLGAGALYVRSLPSCGREGRVACPPAGHDDAVSQAVPAAQACRDAGYLCVGRGDFQVMRWPLSKGRLRVRIPLPDVSPRSEARRMQEAAVRGVLQWDGHPFPIVVDRWIVPLAPWDVELYWVPLRSFSASAAGLTQAEWSERPGEPPTYRVRSMSTVMFEDRSGREVPASSALIEHVAAHEFGHVLGIFHHSDRETDVLFPGGPRLGRVSPRDLRSVDALYRLPNGARVVATAPAR